MTAPALEIERLSVTFEDFVALKEVSLTVTPGESFGLVGESGSDHWSSLVAPLPAAVQAATRPRAIRRGTGQS